MTDFNHTVNLKHSTTTSVNGGLVAILLGTYNGEKFLAEQLDSLENQTHKHWIVIASDDGSSDHTLEILQQYQAKWPVGKLTVLNGPKKGFCQNFLSLACNNNIKADYYAFCDQDDVWFPSKLEIALRTINAFKKLGCAFLYCGRTFNVDNELQPCGMSPLFSSPKTFQNAIIQNIAGGNTMVFDVQAKTILEKVGMVDVFLHDWWLYILVTGSGGNVFYDPDPQILYRQHDGAIVGGGYTIISKLKRVLRLLKGDYQYWNSQNVIAANQAISFLLKENIGTLKTFELLRRAKLYKRIRIFNYFVLSRQTLRGNLSLLLAILLKKI